MVLFYLVNTLQEWLDQYVTREGAFEPVIEPVIEPDLAPVEEVTDSEDEVRRIKRASKFVLEVFCRKDPSSIPLHRSIQNPLTFGMWLTGPIARH